MFYKKRIEELEATVATLIEVLEHNEAIGNNPRRESLWGKLEGTDNANWKLQNRITNVGVDTEANYRVLKINCRKLSALLDYLGVKYVTETKTGRIVKIKKKKEAA